jgi:hypothetical protein
LLPIDGHWRGQYNGDTVLPKAVELWEHIGPSVARPRLCESEVSQRSDCVVAQEQTAEGESINNYTISVKLTTHFSVSPTSQQSNALPLCHDVWFWSNSFVFATYFNIFILLELSTPDDTLTQ